MMWSDLSDDELVEKLKNKGVKEDHAKYLVSLRDGPSGYNYLHFHLGDEE